MFEGNLFVTVLVGGVLIVIGGGGLVLTGIMVARGWLRSIRPFAD